MINPPTLTDKLATDIQGMEALRVSARQHSPEALKATAKQFEALFMNMVMKSMRDATPQEGPFDSQQSKMFTSMLDQQLSQTMAERGIGLADVLIRQLSAMPGVQDVGKGVEPGPVEGGSSELLPLADEATRKTTNAAASLATTEQRPSSRPAHVQEFERRLLSHAEAASQTTGIPAKFMLGQAALESGWGKREIRSADGSPSHNLFGIKAGKGWDGKVVEATTTEYINGVPQKRVEKFRAYDSYADAFRDYGRLLGNNPRYQAVMANAHDVHGFAQGLQRAGYATDPNYADKLTRIIQQSFSVDARTTLTKREDAANPLR
jgi:flagellar protein FlgJ